MENVRQHEKMGGAWEHEEEFTTALAAMVAAKPVAGNPSGMMTVTNIISSMLEDLGFAVERLTKEGAEDVLLATRPGNASALTMGIVGHYDVEKVSDKQRVLWRTDPWSIEVVDQHQHDDRKGRGTEPGEKEPQPPPPGQRRLYGRGVADNLGPLCLRLVAMKHLLRRLAEEKKKEKEKKKDEEGQNEKETEGASGDDVLPPIVWLLHGEEEIGSPWAMQVYPELVASGKVPQVALWLDETGYAGAASASQLGVRKLLLKWPSPEKLKKATKDEDGRGSCVGVTLASLLLCLTRVANRHGRAVALEERFMSKFHGAEGCSVLKHLVNGTATPYAAAAGPNDSWAVIHSPNESIPLDTLAMAADELREILRLPILSL